jgi:hypothetical protein
MARASRLCAVFIPALAVGALARCAGAPTPETAGPSGAQAPAATKQVLTVSNPALNDEDVVTVPSAEGAPRVVFKIKPGPDANGVISGSGTPDKPFNVTFNMCASTDPDNDPMLFGIDIDGNGTLDDQGTTGGHCRQTIPYTAEQGEVRRIRPTMCVVDLDPTGAPRRERTCKTYNLEVYNSPPPPPSCGTGPGWAAAGTGANPYCVCSLNGQQIGFNPGFANMCFSAGFFAASWSQISGTCNCL